MNIKIQKLLFILLPVIVFIYFLIPIDFIWFIFLNLLIGIIESIVFLVLKKERIRGIVSFISVFVSFFIYLILYKNLYYYYHISWNIVFFTLSLINIFNPFFYFFQNYPNKKKLIEFICIFILVLFKSFIFDTKYYYATTSSSLIQDVRYLRQEGYYKVIGTHKLLRKNPERFTDEDYEHILYFFNNTDWLEKSFPNSFDKKKNLIDNNIIKNNNKYVCSAIGLYNIIKCDIYLVKIPINKKQSINLYIPKGTFYLYEDSDKEKDYNQQLKIVNNYYYEGILLPPLTEERFKEWCK